MADISGTASMDVDGNMQAHFILTRCSGDETKWQNGISTFIMKIYTPEKSTGYVSITMTGDVTVNPTTIELDLTGFYWLNVNLIKPDAWGFKVNYLFKNPEAVLHCSACNVPIIVHSGSYPDDPSCP